MLGYIKPDKPELKIKEFEIYGGYYCGICKSIARRYGQLPRMMLNYDSVFLALLISGISPEAEHIEIERCIVHPAKKRTIIYDNPAIDYAADILLLLAYYKLRDDFQDERSIKAAIGSYLMQGTFRKLTRMLPEKSSYVKEQLSDLSNIEKECNASIDRSAEPFAKLMEEVFDCPQLENAENPLDLHGLFRRIGYHLGKWIYLIDAFDDIEENLKDKSFNPLIIQFAYEPENETVIKFKERIKERVETNLLLYLAEIAKCCSALNLIKNQGLIENIVFLGLMRKTEEIFTKGIENNAKSI